MTPNYIFSVKKKKIFDLDVLRNILFKIYHLFVKKFSLRSGFLLFEKIWHCYMDITPNMYNDGSIT